MNAPPIEDVPAHVVAAYLRLNARQRAFALALPLALNQKTAARLAGYSTKTAEARAFKLAKHPGVALVAEFVSRWAIQRVGLSMERALEVLADVALLDPGVIFDERNCIKPLSDWPQAARRAVTTLHVTEHPGGGRTVRVRFAGKIEAADKILRALGAYA